MTTIFFGTITSAATVNGSNYTVLKRTGNRGLSMQMTFTYGSGGTTVDAKIQTSLDNGTTWVDIWHATQFLLANSRRIASVQQVASVADSAASTSLAAASTFDGILGPMVRVTYTSTGTYAGGTTLQVDVYGDQLQVNPAPSE